MNASFGQRHGLHSTRPITSDFPTTARTGLMFVLQTMVSQDYIKRTSDTSPWKSICVEIMRTNKTAFSEINFQVDAAYCQELLAGMRWDSVFVLCERVYSQLLVRTGHWDQGEWTEQVPVDKVRQEYAGEINNLLSEENISFVFEDGEFRRSGRPQTHKNITKANAILSVPRLQGVRQHFSKASQFFFAKTPDFPNSIKEALCALEVAIEVEAGLKVSKDFARIAMDLAGTDPEKIPAPIVQLMIKLHAYRGAAEGVAHGTTEGLRASQNEAELILSIVAALITYIVDHFASTLPEALF